MSVLYKKNGSSHGGDAQMTFEMASQNQIHPGPVAVSPSFSCQRMKTYKHAPDKECVIVVQCHMHLSCCSSAVISVCIAYSIKGI